jgi:hypothetical protein
LTPGFSEGVCFTVDRRIVFLDAPVVTSTQEVALPVEQGRANRDAAFGKPGACFGDRYPQHRFITLRSHLLVLIPASTRS